MSLAYCQAPPEHSPRERVLRDSTGLGKEPIALLLRPFADRVLPAGDYRDRDGLSSCRVRDRSCGSTPYKHHSRFLSLYSIAPLHNVPSFPTRRTTVVSVN